MLIYAMILISSRTLELKTLLLLLEYWVENQFYHLLNYVNLEKFLKLSNLPLSHLYKMVSRIVFMGCYKA